MEALGKERGHPPPPRVSHSGSMSHSCPPRLVFAGASVEGRPRDSSNLCHGSSPLPVPGPQKTKDYRSPCGRDCPPSPARLSCRPPGASRPACASRHSCAAGRRKRGTVPRCQSGCLSARGGERERRGREGGTVGQSAGLRRAPWLPGRKRGCTLTIRSRSSWKESRMKGQS